MSWVMIAIVVAVVLLFLGTVFIIKGRRKNAGGAPSGKNMQNHMAKTEKRVDEKLAMLGKKSERIRKESARIEEERKGDHEKIRDADNWDDLMDVARDIESRRNR